MVCLAGFDGWSLLGTSANGHKLRGLQVPDTAVIDKHVLKAWYYTEKQTGVLHATPSSQLSTAALLHKLTGQHPAYERSNPNGLVAVAYFANCITRLVNAKELQQLLLHVYVGAVPEHAAEELAAAEEDGLQLLALQAYITPANDERYVTTFGGIEGAATLTQVRCYSSRFTAGASGTAAAAAAAAVIEGAAQAGAAAAAAATAAQYGLQAAATAAGTAAASAAHGLTTRGSCCGSIISFCSQPVCSGDGSTSQLQGEIAAAAGDAGGGGRFQDSIANGDIAANRIQHQHKPYSLTEHGIGETSAAPAALHSSSSAEYTELRLRTSILELQDGCATPTLQANAQGLRCSGAACPDLACCSSSNDGMHALMGGRDSSSAAPQCQTEVTELQLPTVRHAAAEAEAQNNGHAFAGTSSKDEESDSLAHSHNCDVQAAPGMVARAAAAALQVLVSFLDKSHGLRVQGIVAEFIKDLSEQLWLIGLHSITLDPQQSRGSSATFTERWEDFQAGAAPPPAPYLPRHTAYGCSAAAAPTGNDNLSGRGIGSSAAQSPKCAAPVAAGSSGGAADGSSNQLLNRQFFPLLSVDVSELPRCRPQSADAAGTWGCSRTASAPRCLRATSPQLTRPSSSPSRQRPAAVAAGGLSGSLDSHAGGGPGGLLGSLGKVMGGSNTTSGVKGATGVRYISRNAASAARPGAGGNPTSRSSCSDSYTLWVQQPVRPADSVTAQLACQLEWAKEQVQQYADLAEATQLQASSAMEQAAQQVSSVQQELLQLRHDASAASRERRMLQQQVLELEAQRSSSASAIAAYGKQLADLQEQLVQDRATLVTLLRQHQQQKQQLEEEVMQLQQHNSELRSTSQQLAARLDEESEVVSALRAQLVDYKLQMEQMQLQAKKGRSLYTQNSTAGGLRRGGSSTPPMTGQPGSIGVGFPPGGLSSSGLGPGSSNGMGPGTALLLAGGGNGAAGAMFDGGAANWSSSSSGVQRSRPPALGPTGTALSSSGDGVGQVVASAAVASQSAPGSTSSSRLQHTTSAKVPLAPHSSTSSRRSTGEYFVAMLGPNLSGSAAAGGNLSAKPGVVGPGTLLLQQLQQQRQRQRELQPAGQNTWQQPQQQQVGQALQLQQLQSRGGTNASPGLPLASDEMPVGPGSSSSGGSSARSAGCEPQKQQQQLQRKEPRPQGQEQQVQGQEVAQQRQQGLKQKGVNSTDPDAAVAAITAAIKADLGEPLAEGRGVKPQLFIGDLLVGPTGAMLPTAENQLAVIGGLFQEVAGDLMEVYSYYALLGSSVTVVADRVTMDLKNLGKLASDLHVNQDSKSLSAVEDVFYLLSDRRPCLALKTNTRPPSAEPLPARPGHRAANSNNSANHMLFGAAAAAAAAAAGSAYLGPGTQHAVARATASEHMGLSTELTANAAAAAAAVMVSVLGPEVIVPEQFPEVLVRLACVRYRWGVINNEYDWDDDSDDWGFEEEAADNPDPPEQEMVSGSPRMNRLQQQQKLQQDQRGRRGPKVLRPEGKNLYTSKPPAVALRGSSSRSASPGRSAAAEYAIPTAQYDLVTVVKVFLQYEVLKHARRNRLAGSPLGHRRAQSKPPNLMGWSPLPQGVIRE